MSSAHACPLLSSQKKAPQEIEEWDTLVTEVCQAINSKQLVPTLRTQYMRTGQLLLMMMMMMMVMMVIMMVFFQDGSEGG
jgi:hypothetical protein